MAQDLAMAMDLAVVQVQEVAQDQVQDLEADQEQDLAVEQDQELVQHQVQAQDQVHDQAQDMEQVQDQEQKFALQICSTLENVEVVKAQHPTYNYMVKYVCSGCKVQNDNWQNLSLSREFEERISRKMVHHRSRCKSCRQDATIMILPDTVGDYNGDDTQNYNTIAVFDFCGVEPTDFGFMTGPAWTVKSVIGRKLDPTTGYLVELGAEVRHCASGVDILAKFVKVD